MVSYDRCWPCVGLDANTPATPITIKSGTEGVAYAELRNRRAHYTLPRLYNRFDQQLQTTLAVPFVYIHPVGDLHFTEFPLQ